MRIPIILILFCCNLVVCAQNVEYYKLSRKIVNGQSSSNVSGGQFVAFSKNSKEGRICYESNKQGYQVNDSKLSYQSYENGIYTYYGKSYWGNNTYFCFNSDKSVMNVTTPSGDTYIYKKGNAPQGVVTCSLLRGTRQQSNGARVIVPAVPQGGYSGGYNGRSDEGSSTSRQQRDPHNHKCFKCNETGRYTCPCHSTPTFGNKSYHKCSNCGQSHEIGTGLNPHRCKCNDCDGKGRK